MNFVASWWQTLPWRIDPIAFTVGFFSVYWYALFLLLGTFASLLFLRSMKRRGVLRKHEALHSDDIFFFSLVGAFVGGKLGYILFYAGREFLVEPAKFLLPYDADIGLWVGLPGMSYHGAALGAMLALFLLAHKKNFSFWRALDLLALLAPILTFFGRLGNFFTGELYGRITAVPWGMYFPGGGLLRHPSALYEALGEGIFLFCLVLVARKRFDTPGALALFYLAAYSVIRFVLEFFREPDSNRGLFLGIFSQGQVFSLFFLGVLITILWKRRKKHGILSHVNPDNIRRAGL